MPHCEMPTLLLYCVDGHRAVHHCPHYSVLIQVLTWDIILRYLVCVDLFSLIVFRILNTSEHIGFKGVPFFDQLTEVLGIKMFDHRKSLQVSRQFARMVFRPSSCKCSSLSLPRSPS